jgi:alpha/beta superfamily hydrolase
MADAHHRNIFIPGPTGRMESVFWTPARPDPPVAAVVCHPHPLFGGTMHNKVVYQVARTLDRLGLPVLRFNFRGVGLSEGVHDKGMGERDDVRAALDFIAGEFPGLSLMIAGFSFGCWVGLRVGCEDARVVELVGLGTPAGESDFSYLASCTKPRLLIQGENDQFGSPAQLETLVATFPESVKEETQVVIIPGADHFFQGLLDPVGASLTAWLKERHPALAGS